MNTCGPVLLSDKPLPHAKGQELAVLSCLLQDPKAVWPIAAEILKPDDFYVPQHRKLFELLASMCREDATKVDVITVMDQPGIADIGGEDFIRDVFNAVPTSAIAETYITGVSRYGDARRLILMSEDAVRCLYEASDANLADIVRGVQANLMAGTTRISEIGAVHAKELVSLAVQGIADTINHDPKVIGLSTGFMNVDRIILGLRRGELIVIAARPSIGKTAFAVQVAMNIANTGAPVGVFSLEMDGDRLIQRLICAMANIDMRRAFHKGLSNQAWQDIHTTSSAISKTPLYIDSPRRQINGEQLQARIRRMYAEFGIQAVFIDYLQLVKMSASNRQYNREQEVALLSGELKSLASQLKIPIVILAQLNRLAEGDRPKMSHLRESGAIEQDADIVALLHRERETDNPDVAKAIAAGQDVEAELIIAKDRNGATGIANLAFTPRHVRFADRSAMSSSWAIPNP